jgi:hypothetical protein
MLLPGCSPLNPTHDLIERVAAMYFATPTSPICLYAAPSGRMVYCPGRSPLPLPGTSWGHVVQLTKSGLVCSFAPDELLSPDVVGLSPALASVFCREHVRQDSQPGQVRACQRTRIEIRFICPL